MHMARGGMHRGGRGEARASCASPLGTPLVPAANDFPPADDVLALLASLLFLASHAVACFTTFTYVSNSLKIPSLC
jgi:hypothetical protein